MNSFYETLQVKKSATQAEIRKKYKQLAFNNHPSINPKNGEVFVEISEAYETLKDKNIRLLYDLFGNEILKFAGDSQKLRLISRIFDSYNVYMLLFSGFTYLLLFLGFPFLTLFMHQNVCKIGSTILAFTFTLLNLILVVVSIRMIKYFRKQKPRFSGDMLLIKKLITLPIILSIQSLMLSLNNDFSMRLNSLFLFLPTFLYISIFLALKIRKKWKGCFIRKKDEIFKILSFLAYIVTTLMIFYSSIYTQAKIALITISTGILNAVFGPFGNFFFRVPISCCFSLYVFGCLCFENLKYSLYCRIALVPPYIILMIVLKIVYERWSEAIPNSWNLTGWELPEHL